MHGISKQYPGVQALADASLEVRAGEVHVLVGENGAGKSTLMRILSGAVQRDAGEVVFDGQPVALGDPMAARRLGISTIYQELILVPHMTAAENIFLGKAPTRWPGVVDRPRMRREALRILSGLGMPLDVDAPVRTLRLAQQQMV
jgi:ribose transport system ATP-binding protein